jgi:hypothetical protein
MKIYTLVLGLACVVVLAACQAGSIPASTAIGPSASEPTASTVGNQESAKSAMPKIFVSFSGLSKNNDLLEFGDSAKGNIAPIRQLPFYRTFAADHRGNFWTLTSTAAAALYSSSGVQLELLPQNFYPAAFDPHGNIYQIQATPGPIVVDCQYKGKVSLREFAASSGGTRLVRIVQTGSPCSVPGVGVDGSGDVYEAQENVSQAHASDTRIAVYAAGNNGPKPTRMLRVPCIKVANAGIRSITVNKSGNVLVDCYGKEFFYRAGEAPYQLLTVDDSYAITMDDRDDIYAVTATPFPSSGPPCSYTISVYAAGASKPFKQIAGSKTRFPTNCHDIPKNFLSFSVTP